MDSTSPPGGGDRRSGDRRQMADPNYRGPERRTMNRRSGIDRRRSSRITPPPPA